MQKKLYFLDEQEKNRILYLHESRTKGQYLLNEVDDLGTQQYQQSQGVETTKEKTPQQKKFDDKKNRVKTLDSKCSGAKVNKNNPLYLEFGNWINSSGKWQKGRLEKILKKINNLQQYCEVSQTLKSLATPGQPYEYLKKSIGEYLESQISRVASWTQWFEQPLKPLLDSVGLNKAEKGASSNEAWKKYPCVTTTGKKYSLPDGSFVYGLDGYYFYGNGRKMNLKTKEMSNFVCDENDNTKIKDFKPEVPQQQPATNYQQVAGGYVSPNLVTPEKIQQIRTTIGSQETSKTLSQTDINNLYTTLFNALPKKQ